MTNLQVGKIEELKGGFNGEILLPSDSAYDSARQIWNAMIQKRPAVIARCATTSDVVRALNFARDNRLVLAVRGGHDLHDSASCAFARQYDLTSAQAKVSSLVFAGQPLSTIAHSLNVSENTVRSHLKQIFHKTDTHGQMDLVHLHARVCPTLS